MAMNTSSFVVFQKFVKYHDDGSVDVSQVFSKECYLYWLSTRTVPPKRPEESFRKAITSHCRGVDGRKPFPREIEAALLKEMRKKQVWPCFRGTPFNIGKRGYQVRGFWEASTDCKSPELFLSKKRKAEYRMEKYKRMKKAAAAQLPQYPSEHQLLSLQSPFSLQAPMMHPADSMLNLPTNLFRNSNLPNDVPSLNLSGNVASSPQDLLSQMAFLESLKQRQHQTPTLGSLSSPLGMLSGATSSATSIETPVNQVNAAAGYDNLLASLLGSDAVNTDLFNLANGAGVNELSIDGMNSLLPLQASLSGLMSNVV